MKIEKQKERMANAVLGFCRDHRLEDAAIIYTEGDREGCATVCLGQGEVIIMAIHSIIKKFSEEVDKDFIDVIQSLIEIEEQYKALKADLAEFEVDEDE
ncbi:MAG: hypothetical protein IIZ05_03710 [Firmicutes bacterium]|nr:hypothetical protein [Bacillota bacterium]